MLELCRRADLTGVGAAPTRCLPAAQKGEPPSNAAGPEVTPPTSSAASATLLEDIIDPVDMDSGLTANEAAVLTGDEIMYNPFDRPSGEEVVEVIPRDRSRALVGLELPDRRPHKAPDGWCYHMLFQCPE